MAQADMFLELTGIEGESLDDKHPKTIIISSLSWGVSQSGSGASAGGSGVGKASLSDIHVTKVADKASMNLFINCCTGKHIDKGTIYIRKSGSGADTPKDYETIKLTEVFISAWQQSASDGGGLPSESIGLNFSKIEFSYQVQNADGSLQAASPKTYDLKLNKAS